MAFDKYNAVKESRKDIFVNNLVGGIAWGLGATVGLAIVLTILGYVFSKFDTVPVVGEYVKAVNMYIQTAKH
jgi:hypothetical protein